MLRLSLPSDEDAVAALNGRQHIDFMQDLAAPFAGLCHLLAVLYAERAS